MRWSLARRFVLDPPEHPCGRPGGDREGRDVLGHHGVCSDHAPLADRHAARHDHVRAAPHVVTDARWSLAAEALPRHRRTRLVETVAGIADEATISKHAVLPDLD